MIYLKVIFFRGSNINKLAFLFCFSNDEKKNKTKNKQTKKQKIKCVGWSHKDYRGKRYEHNASTIVQFDPPANVVMALERNLRNKWRDEAWKICGHKTPSTNRKKKQTTEKAGNNNNNIVTSFAFPQPSSQSMADNSVFDF